MVRKQQSQKVGIEALEELEKETDSEVKQINNIKRQEFKNELDTAFYFSVVFDTKAERDKWLKDRELRLVENFFIRAKDFKV